MATFDQLQCGVHASKLHRLHNLRQPDVQPVKQWFNIETADDSNTADVYLYDAIGGWFGVEASNFVKQLAALDVDQINVYVNSPGGEVFDGIAIRNAMRRHKAKVVATVDGLAASAASFILTGADEVIMGANSQLMIHDAWGMAVGDASVMSQMATELAKVSDNIADMYAQRGGGTAADWRTLMLAETWYSADEAVEAGLADSVDKQADNDAKNKFDLSIFAHAGRDDAPAPGMPGRIAAQATPKPPAQPADHTNPNHERTVAMTDLTQGLRDRLGITDADVDENGLLAALDEALAEQADTQPTNTLPDGIVTIDQAQLEQLQADATAGREARDAQNVATRVNAVDTAIAEGRIPPARRDHWLAQLEADPGAGDTLANLEPIINLEPKGFTGGVDEAPDEDLYTRFYGSATDNSTKED